MAFTPQLLLQRQLEASGSFRDAIRSASQLSAARATIAELNRFMPTVAEIAAALKIPLENVFQCLMQIGLGGSVGFDQQARKGAVPMHQAKVLDRNALLEAQSVEPTLRKQVPTDELERLVANSQTLRAFLRMKVEDKNDFEMARKMVSLAHDYLTEVHRLAEGDEAVMFRLYTAETEEEVESLSGGRCGGDGMLGATLGGCSQAGGLGATVGSLASTMAATTKPLPRNLIVGLQAELAQLKTGKEPVAQRQAALATVADWLQRADAATIEAHFEDVLATLHQPIRLHLAEKRSGIVRLAASAVTMAAVRSPPYAVLDGPRQSAKARLIFGQWLDTLFKSVFVTVSAIADATDETVRDVIVATGGASFALGRVAEALRSASQAVLKRKLLNYVAICLLTARRCDLSAAATCNGGAPVEHSLSTDMAAIAPLLSAQLQSGDAGVRRAARAATIVATDACGAANCAAFVKGCPALADAAVAKAVAADRAAVTDAVAGGIEVFELEALGCSQPCTATLFWAERCGVSVANECVSDFGGGSVDRAARAADVVPSKGPIGSVNVKERGETECTLPPIRSESRASPLPAHSLVTTIGARRPSAVSPDANAGSGSFAAPPSNLLVTSPPTAEPPLSSASQPPPLASLSLASGSHVTVASLASLNRNPSPHRQSSSLGASGHLGSPPPVSCSLLHRKRSLSNSQRALAASASEGAHHGGSASGVVGFGMGSRLSTSRSRDGSDGTNGHAPPSAGGFGASGSAGSAASSFREGSRRLSPPSAVVPVSLAPSSDAPRPHPSPNPPPSALGLGLLPSIYANKPPNAQRLAPSAQSTAPHNEVRLSTTSPSIAGAMPMSLGLGRTRSRSRPQ